MAWKLLTDEQKQPYNQRSEVEKQRVKQEWLRTHPANNTTSTNNSTQSHTAQPTPLYVNVATELKEEEKERSNAVRDERKEAIAQVQAVEAEFSELSPALSSRRPSDPSLQPPPVGVEPPKKRRLVAVDGALSTSPRPLSAMRLFINDSVERSLQEAREKRLRALKGDAQRAARQQWEQMTDLQRRVSTNSHTLLPHTHPSWMLAFNFSHSTCSCPLNHVSCAAVAGAP